MIELRAYQLDAIQQMRDKITAGRRAPLCISPTGSGKSVMLAELARLHLDLDPAHRVLIVAHRRELINQIAGTLWNLGLRDIGKIMPGVPQCPGARIQVASTQTLRARNQFPPASLVVFDECVTGDTMVGGKRADSIRVGDVVDAMDHSAAEVVERAVSHVFKKQASRLLTIHVGSVSLTCTPNHPIWIERRGYIHAEDVNIGDVCGLWGTFPARLERAPTASVQPAMCSDSRGLGAREASDRKTLRATDLHDVLSTVDAVAQRTMEADVLSRVQERESVGRHGENECNERLRYFAENARSQSDENRSGAREGVSDTPQDRSSAEGARRQWATHVVAAKDSLGRARIGVDPGAYCYESIDPSEVGYRLGESSQPSGRGSGWPIPYIAEGSAKGRRERRIPSLARVDRIEVHEPGSDGSFGGRAHGGVVYNFEVEDEHNFFANGILTHNCHHYSSDDWHTLAKGYPDAIRVGFTATPMRSDGRGMSPAFDSLIVVATIKALTAIGFLVPCRVIAAADKDGNPLERPNLSHSPVDAYLAHANGQRTVVFADFVSNAEKFVAEFREKGVDAVIIHGKLSDRDRKAALDAHARGAVLVNCMVLTEGWDSPETAVCILAKGCGSVGTYLQIVGRVLRPAPGKTEALLIDLTGRSFDKHGPPDDDRLYSLTGKGIRAKGEGDIDDTVYCAICGQPCESWPCDVCGHMPKAQTQEEPVYTGDELKERYSAKRKENDVQRVETLSRFFAEAKAWGYKSGHALGRYAATYKVDAAPHIQEAARFMSAGVAVSRCVECGKLVARNYGGKCGKCAFDKRKVKAAE